MHAKTNKFAPRDVALKTDVVMNRALNIFLLNQMRMLYWPGALLLLALGVLPAWASRADVAPEKVVAAFRADLTAKVKVADQNYDSVIAGKDGWLFFAPEVRSVSVGKFWGESAAQVSRSVKPENADPLPAILDFKRQLDQIGVRLLLVPVPPKTVIYADKISAQIKTGTQGVLPRLDSAHHEFYQLLRKNGVQVLDLTDTFLAERDTEIVGSESGKLLGQDPIYCRQDTHWSPRACATAAYQIKKVIGDSVPKPKRKYTSISKSLTTKGDLWDALPAGVKRPQPESLILSTVGTPDPKNKDALIPIPTSRESPVLLLGDSHTLVFHAGGDMHAEGAGLVDHLALSLGYPIDLLGVRGSGATPARVALLRRARENPIYLKHKKWVIWCFSAREFTESAGWQKVPIVK
jgi:alginate O-acetyltransferase complex protein AlgJ